MEKMRYGDRFIYSISFALLEGDIMTQLEGIIVRNAYLLYRAGKISKQDAIRLIHREASRNGYNAYKMLQGIEAMWDTAWSIL